MKNGVVPGGFTGITTTNGYTNRLQVALLSAAKPGGTIFSLTYTYSASNNGQIASIVNNLNNGRTQSYTYDTVRRLATAQSQATSGADCWGESFGYERWANFLTATVTKCSAPAQSLTVSTTTNRITNTGFTYNNSGDLTNENGPAYTWDAEEQLTSAGGVTYTYDGNSLRVKKSNGKLYWRGMGIDALAETDASGNTTAEFVYFAGQRVALRDGGGNVYYIFADHLGSGRIVTDSGGTVCRDLDYFPYGGEKITLNTCTFYNYKFAGYERDSESGLDYAIFRYYNSRLGRFMSPDLRAGSTSNPQSLNRYAYVLNDPINLIDPLGLDCDSIDAMINGCDAGTSIWTPGETLGTPAGMQIPSPTIWDILPNLSPCAGPQGAFVQNCGATLPGTLPGGIPIYSFGNGALDTLKSVLPSVCGGGGFTYFGLGFESKNKVKGELLGVIQWDSKEGGSHGGILAGGWRSQVGGWEWTRTWKDWKEHSTGIYLPGGSSPVKKLGPQKVDKDFGGILQFIDGHLVVGAYGGLSGAKALGRAGGLGLYLNLGWSGCRP